MKLFIFILGIASMPILQAASCCVGGGPKSFIQLRNFEKYQLGLSFSYKNNYAKYTPYGTFVETKKKETISSNVGAGARLRDDLDAYVQVPFSKVERAAGLGDIVLGTRYILLDPLYVSEWYPKISLNLFLKTPTGSEEQIDSSGNLSAGTGNGIWEPALGVTFEKDNLFFLINLGATFTYRSEKKVVDLFSDKTLNVKEGDKFELSESVIFPLTESLSAALGSNQSWELATQIDSRSVSDSHGRAVSGFLSCTYFISRFWKVTLGLDSTIPLEGWGTSLLASRSVSLTSTYSLY